jgi:5-methylthioadenosine/S-adenosylhomocysteine deaminase
MDNACMLLQNCRYVVTQNGDREILEHVDILIEGNSIIEIGKGLARKHPKEKAIDCSERIVMPGLINCHTHLGMSGLRGISDDKELGEWLKDIIDGEHALSKKELEDGATLGLREALRTGTTTIVDHYWDQAVLKAADDAGARVFFFQDFFIAARKSVDIEGTMPKSDSSRITIGIAPHSIYGTDRHFLSRAREYATKHGRMLHIHVAETRKERVECKQQHNMLPIEYLEHLSFLGPDVMLAHMIWVTKGELDTVARRGASVVHCPQSNMKLAGGGTMPLLEMRERGITVALGTDSTASNNSLDMFREMHVAALLHKYHYWDPTAADAQFVLDMATLNGAKALHRNDLGSIEAGKTADIIMLDTTDENLQPLGKERIISHLVYAANGMNVSEVIVDGRLLLRNKKFV